MKKKFIKRAWKIGNHTFWTDEEYNYTIHSQNLNDIKENGKRKANLYRWNPKYASYLCGKHNIEDCEKEIIMRAFVILYPDVKEYEAAYNSMYCCNKNADVKETATNTIATTPNTVDILVKALRQQAKMLEESLQKQAEMNNAHVEEIINIVTATSNTVVTDSNTDVDITADSTDTVADSTANADNNTVNDATNTVDHNTAAQEKPKKRSLSKTVEATIDKKDDDDEE